MFRASSSHWPTWLSSTFVSAASTALFFSCMNGRALILPPVNRNDAKVTEQLNDHGDSRS
jgi:hypothetical protein